MIEDYVWQHFNWPAESGPSNASGLINSLRNMYQDAVDEVGEEDPWLWLALDNFVLTAQGYRDTYEANRDEPTPTPTNHVHSFAPLQGWARVLLNLSLSLNGEHPVATHPLYVVGINHAASLCGVYDSTPEAWEATGYAFDAIKAKVEELSSYAQA